VLFIGSGRTVQKRRRKVISTKPDIPKQDGVCNGQICRCYTARQVEPK
jgi:hypothetical protein